MRYGWKRDLFDDRNHKFDHLRALRAAQRGAAVLPASVDLRPLMPPVYDQGDIGSCTANALAGAVQYMRRRCGQAPDWVPSRMMIYFYERAMRGVIDRDDGAYLRDGATMLAKQGVCPESFWPYVPQPPQPDGTWPTGSVPTTWPDANAVAAAASYQVRSYERVTQDLDAMRATLAAGFPFVFGFTVYNSLYDAVGLPRVHVPMPTARRA